MSSKKKVLGIFNGSFKTHTKYYGKFIGDSRGNRL